MKFHLLVINNNISGRRPRHRPVRHSPATAMATLLIFSSQNSVYSMYVQAKMNGL